MGYSHGLNVPLHKYQVQREKEQLYMKPDRHYHKQVIKVNIMDKDKSPLQTPSCPFLSLTPYAKLSPEAYAFYFAWGLTPCTRPPLHVGALFILFGLTPHLWLFPSATTTWIPLPPTEL